MPVLPRPSAPAATDTPAEQPKKRLRPLHLMLDPRLEHLLLLDRSALLNCSMTSSLCAQLWPAQQVFRRGGRAFCAPAWQRCWAHCRPHFSSSSSSSS